MFAQEILLPHPCPRLPLITHRQPRMEISRVTKCHLHNKCYPRFQFQECLINNLERINNIFIIHARSRIKLFINA